MKPLLPTLALLVGLAGCTWSSTYMDYTFVDEPADASCAEIFEEVREDSWSGSVRGTAGAADYPVFAHVVSVDDTWVVVGEVERIYRGTALTASKHWMRGFRLELRCGADVQPLPVRTCRRAGRAHAIVDGRAIRRVAAASRDYDCHVGGEIRVGHRWQPVYSPVELHPSLRTLVEEG